MGVAQPNEYAKLNNVLLLRWSRDKQQQLAWRIDTDDEFFDAAAPLYLQAHDVLYVPSTTIGYVNRWVDHYIRRLIPFPIPPPAGL